MIRYAVLMVEDQFLEADILAGGLTMAGYDVTTAYNGSKALNQLYGPGAHFDAIVTDINLGKGPDGWDVSRHARARFPGIPVVYATGESAALWRAEGVPGSLFVGKPFKSSEVAVAVSCLLNTIDWIGRDPLAA